jgi:charged multivesicular body protein 5
LDIDDVEDLADDMAEMMEDFNDINEALGRNFATPEDLDEADLEAELEMLDLEGELEDEVEDATPSYLQASSLPDTPTTELPSSERPNELPAMPN